MRKRILEALSVIGLALSSPGFGQSAPALYQNDFEKTAVDKVPDDLMVLDGAFAVKEEKGNKFLELPGAPLDTFGLLFGPTEKDGMAASARVYATAKGRRTPTFALGVMGVSGYKLQVTPTKKLIELYRGDTLKTTQAFAWESGKWTRLRLQARKTSAGWRIEGKVWPEDKPQPANWTITADDKDDIPAGRATIFGSPFSGTPIRYDDLSVTRPEKD